MATRPLINDDGSPFQTEELGSIRKELDLLNSDERTEYRNQNADAISEHEAEKFLIVSGPGTGKSFLFLNQILKWLNRDDSAKVLVTSFVRKLVADLQIDVETERKLTPSQKKNITASTIHKLARSIVEKNHGTANWRFKPHFKMIAEFWKGIVWQDVLGLQAVLNIEDYTWKDFSFQLHNNDFEKSPEWENILKTYLTLCKFYNAAGFDDLILRAAKALKENPALIEYDHFIIDEYQDFNLAEKMLIDQMLSKSKSVLVVGDDEQVLYENLKSSTPFLIRDLYSNHAYVNGMLPFCSRSSFHIATAAGHFIQQFKDDESIEKCYLPIVTGDDCPKVQSIACATPSTAVDYVLKFVADHKAEIDNRISELESGNKKDAFLLILTPGKEMKFYKSKKTDEAQKLRDIAEHYRREIRGFSEDYYKLLSFYSLSKYPIDNFNFRKVLYYEGVSEEVIRELITTAIERKGNFCDLDSEEITRILSKCEAVRAIFENKSEVRQKIVELSAYTSIDDRRALEDEIERNAIVTEETIQIGHHDEEEVELEDIEIKKIGAVEVMSIVGSKGLSADHVIIIGFDNVNMDMKYVTPNAFYVATTRPRYSLHLLTALGARGATGASAYLDQLPIENIEFYKYKKTGQEQNALADKTAFTNYLALIGGYGKGNKRK